MVHNTPDGPQHPKWYTLTVHNTPDSPQHPRWSTTPQMVHQMVHNTQNGTPQMVHNTPDNARHPGWSQTCQTVHPDGPLAATTVNTRTSPTKHPKAEGPCLQDKFNKQLVKAFEKPGGVKGWGVEGGGVGEWGTGRRKKGGGGGG